MISQETLDEIWAWQRRNFPTILTRPHWPILGVCEEAGELIHAQLKSEQMIRGSVESWKKKQRDAIGDIVVFTVSACFVLKWKHDEVLANANAAAPLSPLKEALEVFACAGAAADNLAHNDGPWAARAAIRHVIIHTRRYCAAMGWDFDEVVVETWNHVKQRDWTRCPVGNVPREDCPCDECLSFRRKRAYDNNRDGGQQ